MAEGSFPNWLDGDVHLMENVRVQFLPVQTLSAHFPPEHDMASAKTSSSCSNIHGVVNS